MEAERGLRARRGQEEEPERPGGVWPGLRGAAAGMQPIPQSAQRA